jgi:hypothetical protein
VGVVFSFGRDHLDGDDAVEGFLPGFVNHSHAAATETLQDVELGKFACDFIQVRQGRGRHAAGSRGYALGQQAGRTHAVGAFWRQEGAAFGTGWCSHHNLPLRKRMISLQKIMR